MQKFGNMYNFPTSGGRTRHVINLAEPGSESGRKAYTFTAQTNPPSTATDGYKNVGLQKTLHVIGKNNTTGDDVEIKAWGYHSFSGEWGVISIVNSTNGQTSEIAMQLGDDQDRYWLLPIEGIERIYIQCTDAPGGNTADVWLGVNSI